MRSHRGSTRYIPDDDPEEQDKSAARDLRRPRTALCVILATALAIVASLFAPAAQAQTPSWSESLPVLSLDSVFGADELSGIAVNEDTGQWFAVDDNDNDTIYEITGLDRSTAAPISTCGSCDDLPIDPEDIEWIRDDLYVVLGEAGTSPLRDNYIAIVEITSTAFTVLSSTRVDITDANGNLITNDGDGLEGIAFDDITLPTRDGTPDDVSWSLVAVHETRQSLHYITVDNPLSATPDVNESLRYDLSGTGQTDAAAILTAFDSETYLVLSQESETIVPINWQGGSNGYDIFGIDLGDFCQVEGLDTYTATNPATGYEVTTLVAIGEACPLGGPSQRATWHVFNPMQGPQIQGELSIDTVDCEERTIAGTLTNTGPGAAMYDVFSFVNVDSGRQNVAGTINVGPIDPGATNAASFVLEESFPGAFNFIESVRSTGTAISQYEPGEFIEVGPSALGTDEVDLSVGCASDFGADLAVNEIDCETEQVLGTLVNSGSQSATYVVHVSSQPGAAIDVGPVDPGQSIEFATGHGGDGEWDLVVQSSTYFAGFPGTFVAADPSVLDTQPVTVLCTPDPEATISVNLVQCLGPRKVTATVTNTGEAESTFFVDLTAVSTKAQLPDGPAAINTETVTLAPGQSQAVTIRWQESARIGQGAHNLTVSSDGVALDTERVWFDCGVAESPAPTVTANAWHTCSAGNGVIRADFVNETGAQVYLEVTIERAASTAAPLLRRARVEPDTYVRPATSGRPDGMYEITFIADGDVVHTTTELVTCDDPTAYRSVDTGIFMSACGMVRLEGQWQGPGQPSLTVGAVSKSPASIVEVGDFYQLTISGRSVGEHAVVANDDAIATEVTVSC